MPRRNNRKRGLPRRPQPLEDEPVTYQALARDLVTRGLASPRILGVTRHAHNTHRERD